MKKSAYFLLAFVFLAGFCFSSTLAQIISKGGIVNSRAIKLPTPVYPPAAKAVKASGVINVQIMIDESGNVISAHAITGHPLLRQAAETAARQAKFHPTRVEGKLVKVSGIIIYNFINTASWQEIGFILGAYEKGLPEYTKELEYLPNRLPTEISDEKTNLEAVFDEMRDSPIERALQINNVLASIRAKLSDRKTELWMLEIGLLKGRIYGSLDNDQELTKNLRAAGALLESRPAGAAENLLVSLRTLSSYADNDKFTQADKERIKDFSRLPF